MKLILAILLALAWTFPAAASDPPASGVTWKRPKVRMLCPDDWRNRCEVFGHYVAACDSKVRIRVVDRRPDIVVRFIDNDCNPLFVGQTNISSNPKTGYAAFATITFDSCWLDHYGQSKRAHRICHEGMHALGVPHPPSIDEHTCSQPNSRAKDPGEYGCAALRELY